MLVLPQSKIIVKQLRFINRNVNFVRKCCIAFMSKIEDIVDTLENRISKVLHKQDVLRHTNEKLSVKLQECQRQILEYQEQISEWSERYETLKTANAMLGSDENKRETKLKINALIRDIDLCIAQLAE